MGLNVINLFSGMEVGRQAAKELGWKIDNWYSSEIDKYAIQIANKNHDDLIQVGDITKLDEQWLKSLPKIDIIMAGSPCQGFSFAGKQLNFDDPRSVLFFEFVRILNWIKEHNNPNVKFLLENVRMKKEYQDVITMHCLFYQPICIDSALVSSQRRIRYYWSNIKCVEQPRDRKIYLKDILENGYVDRDKAYCIDANYFKGGNLKQYFEKKRRQLVFDGLVQVGEADIKGHDSIKRVYDPFGKCPTLTTMGGGHREPKVIIDKKSWRKLTPLECERAQTLPDGYTEGVSNTQRYKMLGNGWTLEVIKHILSFMEV